MDSNSRVTSKAQEILNSFMDEMNSIEVETTFTLSRENCMREERKGKFASDEFRENFLHNGVKRNADAIVTKKGDWVNS